MNRLYSINKLIIKNIPRKNNSYKGNLAFAKNVQVRFRLTKFDPEELYMIEIMSTEKTHDR